MQISSFDSYIYLKVTAIDLVVVSPVLQLGTKKKGAFIAFILYTLPATAPFLLPSKWPARGAFRPLDGFLEDGAASMHERSIHLDWTLTSLAREDAAERKMALHPPRPDVRSIFHHVSDACSTA